jgi:hypothetical protein
MIPARILFVAQAFRTMQRVRMPPEYTARWGLIQTYPYQADMIDGINLPELCWSFRL